MEEDQLQPALTGPQSQLRLAGLLQLRITQAPQLHLNTHRSPTCQLDAGLEQPETPGSAHPLNHSGFPAGPAQLSAAGVREEFGSR